MHHTFNTIFKAFALKWPDIQLPLAIIGAGLALFRHYVYDDLYALAVLLALYAADWVTGVLAARKARTLESRRLSNILVNIAVGMTLLSGAWHFARANPHTDTFLGLVGLSLSGIFYFILSSQLLLSLIENASKLGVLPADALTIMRYKLDYRRLLGMPPAGLPPGDEEKKKGAE